jgi:peptide-methionine (S)-S-oxide reductase
MKKDELKNSYLRLLSLLILFLIGATSVPDLLRSQQLSTSPVIPDPTVHYETATNNPEETAVFAGGCFWGMEAVFERVKGVSTVVSGFSGDSAETANYRDVSAGWTDHAEAVKITYNPARVSYAQLLKIYFSVAHDPTQINRQGPDAGSQYRSAIFFQDSNQQRTAQAYINQLNQTKIFNQAIATQLVPLDQFYAAEDYHQDFIDRNPGHPYVVIHDLPKINQLQVHFSHLYQEQSRVNSR